MLNGCGYRNSFQTFAIIEHTLAYFGYTFAENYVCKLFAGRKHVLTELLYAARNGCAYKVFTTEKSLFPDCRNAVGNGYGRNYFVIGESRFVYFVCFAVIVRR